MSDRSGYNGSQRHPVVPQGDRDAGATYTLIELVGTSEQGIDAAIQNAITRASQTLTGLDWLEVVSLRGTIVDGAVQYFQVTLKVGFRVLAPPT